MAKFSQPVCTAIQIALVRVLRSWGLNPRGIVGHSSGEIAAAYAAGAITANSAMAIACFRGISAANSNVPGGMAAIGLGRDEVAPFLVPGVVIACENSQHSTTISGDSKPLAQVVARIKQSRPDVLARPLHVETAYHSHHMKLFGESYESHLQSRVEFTRPVVNYYSTVTGRKLSKLQNLDAGYWRQNLEQPVLFNSALRSIRQDEDEQILFVELGPHAALKGPIGQILREVGEKGDSYVSCLHRSKDNHESLLRLAGEFFSRGINLDLGSLFPRGNVLTDLPRYPWLHETQYWDEPRAARQWRFRTEPPHELLGARMPEGARDYLWRNMISTEYLPWMADHQVTGRTLFCGTGYIAMAGEAIRQITGSDAYSLRQVVISSGLVLEQGKEVEISTRLAPIRLTTSQDSSWYDFEVSSFNGTCWVKHCSGEASATNDHALPAVNLSKSSLARRVTPASWYDTMSRVGFNYGPAFCGLDNISAATEGHRAAANINPVQRPSDRTYPMHPAVMDQCLQLVTVAAFKGQPRKFRRLVVPTYMEEVSVKPCTEGLSSEAVALPDERGAFQADMIVKDSNGIVLSIKGFKSSPLGDQITRDDGIPLQSHIEWKHDPNFATFQDHLLPSPITKEEYLLLEEMILNCISLSVEAVQPSMSTPDHLKKHFHWMHQLLDSHETKISNAHSEVMGPQTKKADKLSRVKAIATGLEGMSLAVAGQAILELFENTNSLFDGTNSALDVLKTNEKLAKLYAAVDFGQYADIVKLLAHKNPRLRVLEVGAGTGGTSEKILKSLTSEFGERMYGSYTYTDISSAFMAGASERFAAYENLEFKTLDIAQNPYAQGFEPGSFDLVIASNVIHATPCLQTSLQHIRKLLKPRGRILMHELSPKLKWINYIMGFLPGWWLGENDNRSTEAYVSPQRWSEELSRARFDTPELIAPDADHPYFLNVTIMASRSDDQSSTERMTLLCRCQDGPLVSEMKELLTARGVAVDICQFGEVLPASQGVISVLDIQEAFLHEITAEDFRWFVKCLEMLQTKMIWVTKPAQVQCKDPKTSLILGLARSVRNELSTKLFTVELDLERGLTPTFEALVDFCLDDRILKYVGEDLGIDYEYHISNGVISIPRFHWARKYANQDPIIESDTARGLMMEEPGLIHTMGWTNSTTRELEGNEVEVEVKVVGLNFKDVLIAVGAVEDGPSNLGLEGSGIVRTTGPLVQTLKPGDRVMFLDSGCFTNLKILSEAHCVRIPAHLDYATAAAIPCVFSTAILALCDRGRMQHGNSILIHSACGGVGLAAIRVAKSLGAEIFCTVGDETKSSYLQTEHGIPKERIYSSRDSSFYTDLMRATDGKGVDIVLNSLAAELLHLSWKCVAEYGTMLEIGKRDLRGRGRLSMEIFEANRSFQAIDLSQVVRERPAQTFSLLKRCAKYFDDASITPMVIHKTFNFNAIQEAFLYMPKGQHIGKLVVEMPQLGNHLEQTSSSGRLLFRSDRSYLMVGGLGGLGRSVSQWMVENGARSLVYLSRSAHDTGKTKIFLDELRDQNCDVTLCAGSVCDATTVRDALKASPNPIGGVINMSMVLKDISLRQMTFDDWRTTIEPKVRGTWNLHQELLTAELDFFILFSSFGGLVGQWGQSNYCAANTFLDAFVQYRQSMNLPASVVDIGVMGEVGIVSENTRIFEQFQVQGSYILAEQHLLDALSGAILRSRTTASHESEARNGAQGQTILGLRTSKPISDPTVLVAWKHDPRMGIYHNLSATTDLHKLSTTERDNLGKFLEQVKASAATLQTEEGKAAILDVLKSSLSTLMLKSEDDLDERLSLEALGMDSLVSIELRNWIVRQLGVDLSVFELVQSRSLVHLADRIAQELIAQHQV